MPSYKILYAPLYTFNNKGETMTPSAAAKAWKLEHEFGECKDDAEAFKRARYWAAENCAIGALLYRHEEVKAGLLEFKCWLEVGRV